MIIKSDNDVIIPKNFNSICPKSALYILEVLESLTVCHFL